MRPHKNGIQFGDVSTKYNKADYNKFSDNTIGTIGFGLLLFFLPFIPYIIGRKIEKNHPIISFTLYVISLVLLIIWITIVF